MSDEQAVVETTDAPVKPEAEAGDAQEKTVEELLNEFETETEPTPEKPGGTEQSKIDWLVQREEERAKLETRQTTQSTVNETVAEIKKSLEIDVPDRMIRGDLYARAEDDERFLVAFRDRRKNPSAWKGVVSNIAKEIRQDFENRPDADATADRNAVQTAVRSISGAPRESAPASNADMENMPDAEFNKMLDGMG